MPERPHMRRDRLRSGPTPPSPPPEIRYPTFAEPPPFRAHPFAGPGLCVDCGSGLPLSPTSPRCWECGRPLCSSCYWRHGLTPADHRCAGCAVRPEIAPTSISGGRATSSEAATGSDGRPSLPA